MMQKRIFPIILMMVLTVSSLWAQERSRVYTYEQRLILASNNLERLECLEEGLYKDSLIIDYTNIIERKELQIKDLECTLNDAQGLYDELSIVVNTQSMKLSENDLKMKKLKKRRNVLRLVVVFETILIGLIWQL